MRRYASLLILVWTAASPITLSHASPPSPALSQVPRQTVTDFVRCVAKRHPREAADFVVRRTPPLGRAAASAKRRLADRRCLPAQSTPEEARALLKMHDKEQLRPALAEALVGEEFPTFDASLINSAQPLEYGKLVDSLWPPDACKKCTPAQLKEFQQARARSSALLAPLVFGECVVRTDPANAHKMLIADAGSTGESAAMHALQPAFEHCVIHGVQFKISPRAVREVVALNYYRLAHAPRAQIATGAPK